MIGICGNEKASDAVVTVNLDSKGRKIEIKSKLKKMFGSLMEKAVIEILDELKIENIDVKVEDFGALDFIIKARTKTAIRRTKNAGGIN
ncbi:citrate lyase acyl carrier protein [Psychrilyobacter atlanticus]|uniref:citrate lyase acyl carrier protein n=1 Tax=Psychrilyobacter atlanticus TaxID=271091 RepID=UPI000401976D|nr:citrate lyase acyl carrier protein [Psychrilyobacter atlanticus]